MIANLPRTNIHSRDLTLATWHDHIAARRSSRLTVIGPEVTSETKPLPIRRISVAPISIANWLAHLAGRTRRAA
jgi:hypothetical protein